MMASSQRGPWIIVSVFIIQIHFDYARADSDTNKTRHDNEECQFKFQFQLTSIRFTFYCIHGFPNESTELTLRNVNNSL